MLVKRQEKEGKIKSMYASSNVCASTYDKTTKDLIIIFNNGGQYKYSDVSMTDYTRFELADSQGKVINSHIKNYVFEKLDAVDTKVILNEVETIRKVEDEIILNATVRGMVDKLKAVVTYYETTGNLGTKLIDNARAAIAEYDALIEPKLDKVNG